jgi:hypothetical protein
MKFNVNTAETGTQERTFRGILIEFTVSMVNGLFIVLTSDRGWIVKVKMFRTH